MPSRAAERKMSPIMYLKVLWGDTARSWNHEAFSLHLETSMLYFHTESQNGWGWPWSLNIILPKQGRTELVAQGPAKAAFEGLQTERLYSPTAHNLSSPVSRKSMLKGTAFSTRSNGVSVKLVWGQPGRHVRKFSGQPALQRRVRDGGSFSLGFLPQERRPLLISVSGWVPPWAGEESCPLWGAEPDVGWDGAVSPRSRGPAVPHTHTSPLHFHPLIRYIYFSGISLTRIDCTIIAYFFGPLAVNLEARRAEAGRPPCQAWPRPRRGLPWQRRQMSAKQRGPRTGKIDLTTAPPSAAADLSSVPGSIICFI